jgi:hypothetical protein
MTGFGYNERKTPIVVKEIKTHSRWIEYDRSVIGTVIPVMSVHASKAVAFGPAVEKFRTNTRVITRFVVIISWYVMITVE